MQQAHPFFSGIPTDALEAALAALERRRFPAGTVILAEGDSRGEMYVLSEGAADVLLSDRKGVEHVVNTVRVGEAFGEMALLTQAPASATVRAADDVEVIVVEAEDLDGLLDMFPQLQRNLISALSARLARVTRLALHEQAGRIVVLEDAGGPALLGFALTASVAWHTRDPAIHIVLDPPPSSPLSAFRSAGDEPLFRGARGVGAELMTATLDGHFSPALIEETLNGLARTYDHVVLQVPRTWTRRLATGRVMRLASTGEDGALSFEARAGGGEHVVRVPPLSADEIASLEHGLLPPLGPGSRAIGAAARELAHLKIGIALGAGSIRGYAHIGVLRGLEQHGVPVDCIAGTSIGATVGAAYALYGDLERVEAFLDGLGERMFRPRVSRKSLLSTASMRRYARRMLGDPLLEDLPVPVAVVATDVDTQDEVVLRRGSIVSAVFASAAVPGVFPAVRLGRRTLVDGGVVNPVPASAAVALGADVVIGVRLVHSLGTQTDEVSEEAEGPIPSAVAAIMRSIELLQTRIGIDSGSVPLVLLTPEFESLPAGKLRNFREGRRYITAGETAVEEAVPRLSAGLPWLRPLQARTATPQSASSQT